MSLTKTGISALDESGNGLVLEFFREQDRFAHTISLQAAGKKIGRLHSVEGNGDQDWPVSPPGQQLSIESQPSGDVALLVGMAGKCHWSMSVQAISKHHSDPKLEFDIACRLGNEIELSEVNWLGSVYRSETSKKVEQWLKQFQFELCEAEQQSDLLNIMAHAPAAGKRTFRWLYSISCTGANGESL